MLVVRVQNRETGIGMFFTNGLLFIVEGLSRISPRHRDFNTPDEDGLDVKLDNKEWFCAYKSIEQFQQWVMLSEVRILIEKGFDVLLLDVEEYQIGEHQVVFTKQSITSTKVINELFL
jgi:hypothetical protein